MFVSLPSSASAELARVHAVLVQTDRTLLDVVTQIEAAGGDRKVIRRLWPIQVKALQDRRRVVAPVLPDCATD